MTTYDEQSRTERELRAALSDRAQEVRPSSRLDAILREASAPPPAARRAPWLVGLAVAAAAAVVAGTVWASRPESPATLPGGPASPSATPGSATTSGSPTPSLSVSSSPSASASATNSPSGSGSPTGTVLATLGIYRVAGNGGEQDRPGLVRDFWRPAAGVPTDLRDRVVLAARESMRRMDPWASSDVVGVDVGADRITVRVTTAGEALPSEQTARLAATALAWTAQAVVGRGDVPVRLMTPDGSRILGRIASGTEFTRAGTLAEDLCDIWLDSPAAGVTLPATQPVVVRGQAVAFEANVEWDLRRGTVLVKDGFTTASVGAPSRGTFSVDLGRLAAGGYTFRSFTTSAKDGSVLAERTVTFTVR